MHTHYYTHIIYVFPRAAQRARKIEQAHTRASFFSTPRGCARSESPLRKSACAAARTSETQRKSERSPPNIYHPPIPTPLHPSFGPPRSSGLSAQRIAWFEMPRVFAHKKRSCSRRRRRHRCRRMRITICVVCAGMCWYVRGRRFGLVALVCMRSRSCGLRRPSHPRRRRPSAAWWSVSVRTRAFARYHTKRLRARASVVRQHPAGRHTRSLARSTSSVISPSSRNVARREHSCDFPVFLYIKARAARRS